MKKKTLYSSLAIIALLMFLIMPVMAISSGGSVTPDITVEEFPPRVWMCDSRIVYDDNTEPGRISTGGQELVERINNYAFEGEQIQWTVLVMDKNKIDQNIDVYATIGDVQGEGNDIEVNCVGDPTHVVTLNITTSITCTVNETLIPTPGVNVTCSVDGSSNSLFATASGLFNLTVDGINISVFVSPSTFVNFSATVGGLNGNCSVTGLINSSSSGSCSFNITNTIITGGVIDPSCNARIDEEILTIFDPDTMRYFQCTFTVETPESMFGEFWITVEAQDGDGNMGTMDENEFWFLNPVIALFVDGDMTFDEVRPGTDSYSSTLLVGNDASLDSGVLMDMFISGTDFYDSSSSGARCPTTNQLSLSAFRYFATSGAYSTQNDVGVDVAVSRGDRNTDAEGYTNIGYGIGFNNPDPFYDGFEIIQSYPSAVQDSGVKFANTDPYYPANILAPGAEMAITFKLSLPEPCNGNFDSGSIFFWGEAI